jgi:hypothetical protein
MLSTRSVGGSCAIAAVAAIEKRTPTINLEKSDK